ncbi:MAG: prolyl oligopeptidase family serine peptidase [Hyphomicrobiales bacterium]
MRIVFLVLIITFSSLASPSWACGPTSHCKVDDGRHYRIRMPENHDGKTPVGAIIFAHSFGATAVGTIRNKNLIKAANDLGVALVAPKSRGRDWHIPNSPENKTPPAQQEARYFDNIIDDMTKRFPIDRSKLLMTGVSAGGMMTWQLICERGDKFAAFVPIAGTFWHPQPKNCKTPPAHVMHVHGTTDTVVPITGRNARGSKQGNVYDVMNMYAKFGRFKGNKRPKPLDMNCKSTKNASGKILALCFHEGGHKFDAAHIAHAWKQFDAAGAFSRR